MKKSSMSSTFLVAIHPRNPQKKPVYNETISPYRDFFNSSV